MKLQSGPLLQIADHVEEILGLRIASWAEHADQALGRRAGRLAQFLESHGRLDGVAKDGFSGFHVAAEYRIDPFAKQRFGEFLVGLGLAMNQGLEAYCPCYDWLLSVGPCLRCLWSSQYARAASMWREKKHRPWGAPHPDPHRR